MHHDADMRTTVTIDDDILRAAKSLATQQRRPLGQVISDLMRKGLQPSERVRRNRIFPVFDVPEGARTITLDVVKQAEEEIE